MKIAEIENIRFHENDDISGNDVLCNVIIQEVWMLVPIPVTSKKFVVYPNINGITIPNNNLVITRSTMRLLPMKWLHNKKRINTKNISKR